MKYSYIFEYDVDRFTLLRQEDKKNSSFLDKKTAPIFRVEISLYINKYNVYAFFFLKPRYL